MKMNLSKCTLNTAIIVSLYAIYRIVQQCCMWSGIYFWLNHPIRTHVIGHGIDMLFDICVAFLLFVLWANRNHLPVLTDKWKHIRNILVIALGYLLIFQMKMIFHYPVWCSRIFYYTLWALPIVYVFALWIYYRKTQTVGTYTLSKARAALVLWTAILLLVSAAVGLILVALWYYNTTEWLDRWHWRIPMFLQAISELLLILFLTIRNQSTTNI